MWPWRRHFSSTACNSPRAESRLNLLLTSRGGFYFTLLLGLEGNSMTHGRRRAGPEDGWLVGEAVAHQGTLRGTIAFYPYTDRGMGLPAMGRVPQADKKPAFQSGRRDWLAKRIAP